MLDTSPIEINVRNAVYWIRLTLRSERFHNADRKRNLSLIRALRMVNPNLNRPVFVIGAPRSGTTFLGGCLAKLPEISYHFEPVVTKAAVRYVYQCKWSDREARILYRVTYAWLMRMSFETDLRFCEKTPGNCFIVPFLYRTFAGAKFIHIVRDGRDAALSLSKKPWYGYESRDTGERDPDGYLYGPSKRFWVEKNRIDQYERTDDLHRCIWLWRRYVESALRGASSIPSEDFFQLNYEDLLSDPASNADQIINFLNINDPVSKKVFRDTVVANARSDSVGRWKKEVGENQHNEMMKEAGQLLHELGYDN